MIDAFKLPTWRERGGEYVKRLERDANLTIDQAAGIVGNLGYESGQFKSLQEIDPMVPGSAGGYGVAQWTGSRRRAFERWCTDKRLTMSSDAANYGFLLHELNGSHRSFASRLRKVPTLEEATRLTHEFYERPSDVSDGTFRSGPERLRLARLARDGAEGVLEDPSEAPISVITSIDRVKAIQVILGVKPDGDFGPISNDALNALLAAAEK